MQNANAASRSPVDLSVNDVLRESLEAVGVHHRPLLVIALCGTLPIQLIRLATAVVQGEPAAVQPIGPDGGWLQAFLSVLLPGGPNSYFFDAFVFVLSTASNALAVVVLVGAATGRPRNLTSAMAETASRLLPLLGVALLSEVVIAIGCVLCLLPGIYAAAALTVVVPVCIVERRGVVESMNRSADLTQGNRIAVLLALLLVMGTALVAHLPLTVSAHVAASQMGGGGDLLSAAQLTVEAFRTVGRIVSMMASAACTATIYAKLSEVRAAIDAPTSASIFE